MIYLISCPPGLEILSAQYHQACILVVTLLQPPGARSRATHEIENDSLDMMNKVWGVDNRCLSLKLYAASDW